VQGLEAFKNRLDSDQSPYRR